MIYEIKDNVIGGKIKDGHYKLKRVYDNRSLDQNAYYWAAVLPIIAEYTGHTCLELHEYFKNEFLVQDGSFIKVYRSTTDLDKEEFRHYIDNIKSWASTYSINIPNPE